MVSNRVPSEHQNYYSTHCAIISLASRKNGAAIKKKMIKKNVVAFVVLADCYMIVRHLGRNMRQAHRRSVTGTRMHAENK